MKKKLLDKLPTLIGIVCLCIISCSYIYQNDNLREHNEALKQQFYKAVTLTYDNAYHQGVLNSLKGIDEDRGKD